MHTSIDTAHELEPQQYERMYFEEDIPLKDISRGLGPRLLAVGIVLFVAIIWISATVTYPDQVQLPFVLRAKEREWVYTFPFPVYIKELFIRSGDQIEEGQPLVRLSSPEIASMIAELEGRQAKETTFENFTGSSYLRQLDIVDRQILQWQARSRQLQTDIDLLDQQWTSRASVLDIIRAEALDHVTAAQSLYKEGVISRQDLQEKERALAQARDNRSNGESLFQRERMALQTQLEEVKQSIAAASLEKSKLEYDKAARSGDLKSEATAAGDLIQSFFGNYRIQDGSIVLLSPASYHVSFVFEGESEIPSGATVLKLNQTASADYAFIKCPPSTAGRLEEGMAVKLKVSSFPHYEWGVATGKVTTRSVSPDQSGLYNLEVSVDVPGRMEGRLFPGLDGMAVIILEEKTLMQYVFRDLAKAYHDASEGEFITPR